MTFKPRQEVLGRENLNSVVFSMRKTVILKTSICVTVKNHLGWEPVSGNGLQSSEKQYLLVLLILQACLRNWC